ncbi:MAG TPA: TIGR01459 family HAD-type hydrolase [Xanthobacteraceae bacterium]|nr:TIGR01459 family HAD-type hydrolase [Xanthobacteraceae bacterium]
MSVNPSSFSSHFATVAPDYDVLLSDVWGVVHNGVAATPNACDALRQFRERGGTVVLITNAPRPGEFVQKFIDGLHVPRDSYDAIVSSGDVTRALIIERAGERVAHIGPARDIPIFEGLDAAVVPVESADYVVCSGLYDDTTEGPDDYDDVIATMLARKLPMICANPDIVVERGEHLVYCAGAIADRYAAKGGDVTYAGKPYRPIYDQAMAAARKARGRDTAHNRVLAIGDSVRTDLKGSVAFGIDCLFVTAGIHAEELGGRHTPDATAINAMFKDAQVAPKFVMQQLVW